jgi:hypothetical protein
MKPNGGNGASGTLGIGGTGGDAASTGGGGGGGGGGGYYGGGGGGGGQSNFDGGGGGGGSSFTAASATNVSGPTVTSAPPSVTIVYPVSIANLSTNSMSFGTRPLGRLGPEKVLTVTNKGSAPLLVSGVLLGGAKPGDYVISNRCQRAVPAGSRCYVGVRFAPQAKGTRVATLTLLSSAANAPGAVKLSGRGG